MRRIRLTQGKLALIDDDDFERINQWKWHLLRVGKREYAKRTSYSNGKKDILLHRFIMNAVGNSEIDHINGNGLDNRRSNLRFCTHSQNLLNSKIPVTNKSGFKGVCWHIRKNKWESKIKVLGKTIHLGLYDNPKEAGLIYQKFIKDNLFEAKLPLDRLFSL